jgi:predicted TIM-barrel fold metal-dependent hydrolase
MKGRRETKKIDCFAHIVPNKFIEAFSKTEHGISWDKISGDTRVIGGQAIIDVNKRIEIMERYEDYVQVLVPAAEVMEPYFSPKDTAYLAQVYNDALAEIVNKHPDKFVAAIAAIPHNNVEAALKEIERAINELGLKGIFLHTPMFSYEPGRPLEKGLNYETMKPLDSPEFLPIYESMSRHNLPIWIHPGAMSGVPHYSGERRGKYMLNHVFGWPMESTMAMGRLIFSGILTKYPNLRFIIHHCNLISQDRLTLSSTNVP